MLSHVSYEPRGNVRHELRGKMLISFQCCEKYV
jgi:hypothetical protein